MGTAMGENPEILEEVCGWMMAAAKKLILLGSDTVQVCTGVMKFGYECVKPMCDELLEFMARHNFETIADFKGKSLDYFTTHADLVKRQAERKANQKAAVAAEAQKKMVAADHEWSGDEFVKQSDALGQGFALSLILGGLLLRAWGGGCAGTHTRAASIQHLPGRRARVDLFSAADRIIRK